MQEQSETDCPGSFELRVGSQAVAGAQAAYDRAIQAYEARQYGAALPSFTAALETPGLAPDLAVDAMLKRAVCRAREGEIDAALSEIKEAEQGPCDMDQVHLARGIVLRQKGDTSAAQAEFQKARQINPQVKLPK